MRAELGNVVLNLVIMSKISVLGKASSKASRNIRVDLKDKESFPRHIKRLSTSGDSPFGVSLLRSMTQVGSDLNWSNNCQMRDESMLITLRLDISLKSK